MYNDYLRIETKSEQNTRFIVCCLHTKRNESLKEITNKITRNVLTGCLLFDYLKQRRYCRSKFQNIPANSLL